jgi:hypothetical protein
MWKCECGEFNNDDLDFCVRCDRVRLTAPDSQSGEKKQLTTQGMFRRIQDFILFDIAFCAIVALYCFFVELGNIVPELDFLKLDLPQVLKTTLPIIAIILFQVLLMINVLRMLYGSAINSERNRLFLQRIYRMLSEKENEKNKSKKE